MKRYLIPAVLFLVLVGFLAVGLKRDPRDVPSPLIGKPAPKFTLPHLEGAKSFSTTDMLGQVWMLNVWASWCVSCRDEHPVLVKFASSGDTAVPIVGLNYKDQLPDAKTWLKRFGDPYVLSAFDLDGRVGIDYGLYGVPETYIIDKRGTIRLKHTGPITEQSLATRIVPLIAELKKEGG
jgi:cytochrome c biogenesis protein CcmG, thiol:disulfide interchange protein DsbE